MANEIITTLHPDQDPDTNLYPNIKKENIPNRSIDMAKLDRSIEGLLNNIGELNPSGVDTSTHILAFTTDRGIYIGSDTGHWYYWDGTHYVDGGVYQATAIADGSIILSQLANSLKDILAYGNGILSNDITDLNDIRLYNKFVRVTSAKTQDQLANCPYYSFQGVIYTLYTNDSSVCVLQLVQNASGNLYYRTKWANWSSWKQFVNSDNFSTFFSNVLTFDTIIKEYGYGSYPNLNDAPRNSVISYTSTSGITNQPEENDHKYQGVLLTFGSNDISKTQIYITAGNDMFYRRLWGANWYSWRKNIDSANINEYLKEDRNILPMFTNLTFIGDSLTYSQVYTSSSTSRQAKTTYPKIVGKLSGIPLTNINEYANGGYAPSNWWLAYNQYLVSRVNNLYIIYLGTNGGLTDTIDTDCPDNQPIENWATTETGYYGRILKTIYDLGEKAILIKVYASGGDVNTTNTTIEKFGTKYDFPVIDNDYLSNSIYHYYPDLSGQNSVHYNDLGYSAFANNVIKKISNMSDTMLTRLIKEHN